MNSNKRNKSSNSNSSNQYQNDNNDDDVKSSFYRPSTEPGLEWNDITEKLRNENTIARTNIIELVMSSLAMSTNELADALSQNRSIYLRKPNSIHPYRENGIWCSGYEQVVIPQSDNTTFDIKDRNTNLFIEQGLTYEETIKYIITQSTSAKLQPVFNVEFISKRLKNVKDIDIEEFCLEYMFCCIFKHAHE